MKKHGVLLSMINNFMKYFFKYSVHPRRFLLSVFTMPIKKTKIIPIVIYQDVFPNQIFKNGSIEKIDNFLKISEKISKKRRLINCKRG